MSLIEEKNRIISLMGIKESKKINDHENIEVSKLGADGNVYAIIQENQKHYIKKAKYNSSSELMLENFDYLGGIGNKHKEGYLTYEKALTHLKLKLQNVNENCNLKYDDNVYKSDYLIKEEKERLNNKQCVNENNLNFNEMFHKTRLKMRSDGNFIQLKEDFNPYSHSGQNFKNIEQEEEITPEYEVSEIEDTDNIDDETIKKDVVLPNGDEATVEIDIEIEPKDEDDKEDINVGQSEQTNQTIGFGGFSEGTKLKKKQIMEMLSNGTVNEDAGYDAEYDNLFNTTITDGDLYRNIVTPVIEKASELGQNSIDPWFEVAKIAFQKFRNETGVNITNKIINQFASDLQKYYQEEIDYKTKEVDLGESETIEEDVTNSGYPIGSLVFIREAGNKGLIGLVTSNLNEDGEQDVYLRGYKGETYPFAPNEVVDIINNPELMEVAKNKGDLLNYPKIASKLGIEVDPKYYEGEIVETTCCGASSGAYDVPLFGKPLSRKITVGESITNNTYELKIKTDNGIVKIKTNAKDEETAKEKICKSEGCPISAIKSIKLVKEQVVEHYSPETIEAIVKSVISETLKKKQ